MPDIIEMLVEFLCQMNTQSQCWSFIGNYAEATQQMVFFIFFPVVFLILFVYFMSEAVIKTHKGLRLLVAFAIYMFIIFQGWYHIVLIVSKFWFIALIILGGIGIVTHGMTGRGLKAGGGAGLLSGAIGKIARRGIDKATDNVIDALGWEERRKRTAKGLIKKIESGGKLNNQELAALGLLSNSLSSSEFAAAMGKNPNLAGEAALLRELIARKEREQAGQ